MFYYYNGWPVLYPAYGPFVLFVPQIPTQNNHDVTEKDSNPPFVIQNN